MHALNLTIFHYLHSLAFKYPGWDIWIIFTAIYLAPILIFCAIIVMLFYKESIITNRAGFRQKFLQKIKDIFSVFAAAAISWGIVDILKNVFHSPRPFVALTDLQVLFTDTGYAFPSGHATFFGALAMSMYLYNKRVGAFFAIGALLVGFARVIAGVHYPVDIVAGYILGTIISYAVFTTLKKITTIKPQKN